MKSKLPLLLGASLLIAAAPPPPAPQQLPTGQALTPLAAPGARFEPLTVHTGPYPQYQADGAAAIAVSPNGREMLVLTSGFNRINAPDGKIDRRQAGDYVLRYAIADSGSRLIETLTVPNAFGGIAWLPRGDGFVVGGGVDDALQVFRRKGKSYTLAGTVTLGHKAGNGYEVKPEAAGVAISPDGARALVANYFNDSVSLIDLGAMKVIAEQDLRPGKIDPSQSGKPGGSYPFAVVWTDPGHAFVSAPRDREVVALAIGPASLRVTSRIATLGEPTVMTLDPARTRLVAAEDNADRLAVIDPRTAQLLAEPRLALPETLGEVPTGKGLNPDGLGWARDGHLLVTLGGINALALVTPEGEKARIGGLVPTGWYPSAVAVSPWGKRVFVVNRKSPPGPNPLGCMPKIAKYRSQGEACGAANQYIFQLEKAGLLSFPLPGEHALAQTTLQVAANLGLPAASQRAEAEAKMAAIRAKVRHVVFIVKENRTYDQVLGDLDRGNGDPKLAILGEALSPNHHRLARGFVTLDNFMNSGEQSSTGWSWSTAARTTDLLERTAAPNYAQRGLAYESEESDRYVVTQQDPETRRKVNPGLSADPDLLPGPANLTAPDPDDDDKPGQGFLWDAAIRAGLSVRNYGFADATIHDPAKPGGVPPIREAYKDGRTVWTPADRLLATRSDRYFPGFDLNLPDFWREREWEREYTEADAAGTLPQLTLLRLGNDHFGDFKTAIDGVNTVEAQMGDNDYAIGKVIETVAHSKAADSTLVFVIEDDAQNGADHVDARRSLAFVVGPYVKQGAVVSARYTTVSLLRTIEAVLGLKPMNLNDALAAPMADVFDPGLTKWDYSAVASATLRATQLPIPPERFIGLANACPGKGAAWWAEAMAGQDFSSEDRLDTERFNAALWRGLAPGEPPAGRPGTDLSHDRKAGETVLPCAARRL